MKIICVDYSTEFLSLQKHICSFRKGALVCLLCDKNIDNFQRHDCENKTDNITCVTCVECGRSFNSSDVHNCIQRKGENEHILTCVECDRTFNFSEEHNCSQRKGKNEHIVTCVECGSSFTSNEKHNCLNTEENVVSDLCEKVNNPNLPHSCETLDKNITSVCLECNSEYSSSKHTCQQKKRKASTAISSQENLKNLHQSLQKEDSKLPFKKRKIFHTSDVEENVTLFGGGRPSTSNEESVASREGEGVNSNEEGSHRQYARTSANVSMEEDSTTDDEEMHLPEDDVGELQQPILFQEKSAFQNAYLEHRYKVNIIDPTLIFSNFRSFFKEEIKSYFNHLPNPRVYVKIKAIVMLKLEKQLLHSSSESEEQSFPLSLPYKVINIAEIDHLLNVWEESILTELPLRINEVTGSGHIISEILSFNILYLKQALLNGLGSADAYPSNIRGKTSVFNPTGNKNSCLIQCLAAYRIMKDKERKKQNVSWPYVKKRLDNVENCRPYVNWSGLNFPLEWHDISRLEILNHVCIYIYTLEKCNENYCLQLARRGNSKYAENFVPLLLYEDQEHVGLIKDFHSYVRKLTRDRRNERADNPYYCRNCLSSYHNEDECESHELLCDIPVQTKFPKQGEKLKFNRHHRHFMYSHIAIYDLEAIIRKVKRQGVVEAEHLACASCFLIIDRHGQVVCEFTHCGMDTADVFIESLLAEWQKIRSSAVGYNIDMTPQNKLDFEAQSTCELCLKNFTDSKYKHAHHDHLLEKNNYIGAYCQRCNQACQDTYNKLLVFAHNASYDLGLLLKQVRKKYDMKILTKQGLKIQKLQINDLMFLDSLQFLSGSLEGLAGDFFKDGKSAKYTEHLLRNIKDDNLRSELLKGKEIMFYDYLDDINKLEETSLPPQSAFFNTLKNKPLSDEDYKRAQRMWEIGECKTLRDYLLLYLRIDVGLLSDILLDWRNILHAKYGLDIAHYVSLPSYAYDCFLKQTGIELDKPYDRDTYNMIKDNVRGGYTGVIRQSFTANNKHINPNFNPEDALGSYLLYLDFNSLYASVMCEMLPKGSIRKMEEEEEKQKLLSRGINNIATDAPLGYWFLLDTKKVDGDLARMTDDLPLGMNHQQIAPEDLSPYCQNILKAEGGKIPKHNKKLVATHNAKENYLISLPLLQLFMEIGLEIERVHSVYEFEQSAYMLDFIKGNVESRNLARSITAKKAFKAMSNVVFGRTMMNPYKYSVKTKIITKLSDFLKEVRNPRLKDIIFLRENRVICTSYEASILIDMPNYVGFQILELAKYKLYHFWYKVIKETYGDKAKLVYTDTDSFIWGLMCEDIYTELGRAPLCDYLDFSNFPEDNPLYDNSCKGKLGLLKSETSDILITDIRALKPKMYCLLLENDTTTSRGKGIPQHEQNKLSFEDYDKILHTHTLEKITVRNIQNVKGQVSTTKCLKSTLSAFDDKRWHIDQFSSYAYEHPDIPRILINRDGANEAVDLLPIAQHTNPVLRTQPTEYQSFWRSRVEKAPHYFSSTNL